MATKREMFKFIGEMSDAEMIEMNKLLVETIKMRRKALAHNVCTSLRVGSKVSYDSSRMGKKVTATVTKVGRVWLDVTVEGTTLLTNRYLRVRANQVTVL
jgi:hypothetical protein